MGRGGAFEVWAAGVEIFVTGTCFRVEVVPMTSFAKMTLSAAGGAAAASAVLVTVYEGRVRIASAGASSEVSAGEQARSEPGTPPRIVAHQGATPPALLAPPAETAPSATREDLLQRTQEERARIAALQSRVRELEKERARLLASQRPGEAETSGTPGRPPGSKFQDFTQAELLAMAQTCELRMDIPPIDRETWQMPPDLGARLHLSEDEQARVAAAVNQLRSDSFTKLRALYLEATGDAAGADSLEPMNMAAEIVHKSRGADIARAVIAPEPAGLPGPPPPPHPGALPEPH